MKTSFLCSKRSAEYAPKCPAGAPPEGWVRIVVVVSMAGSLPVGCGADDDDDDASQADASTTDSDADPTEPVDSEGESTTVDGGCWDRSFEGHNEWAPSPSWTPMTCPGAPSPCSVVEDPGPTHSSEEPPTDEQIAAVTEAALCVAEALANGTPGRYELWVPGPAEEVTIGGRVTYTVLDDGIVASLDYGEDLNVWVIESHRARRPAEFFDACIAAGDLDSFRGCLTPKVGILPSVDFPPLDDAACVDDEPVCPE